MRALLEVADDVTLQVNLAAVRYDLGVHAKHRVTGYHDFFIERIRPGERVLDVGCGKGELAYDIAVKAGGVITAIDLDAQYLAFAANRFKHPNLEFLRCDALLYEPTESVDVVVLSNVLEHIVDRVGFLRTVVERMRPGRILVRVPMINRDWLVPVRKELGMVYFTDATHRTEYTQQTFEEEVRSAGLLIDHMQVNWGEIWAQVRQTK